MPIPLIRVASDGFEYLVFLTEDGQIESIARFRAGGRVGTQLGLHELPWSVRWQVEDALRSFSRT